MSAWVWGIPSWWSARLRLGSGSWCPGFVPFGDAVSRALSASPSAPFPGRPQARKAWESERLRWERWPPRRRGPTPACEGGSCSPRRPWGAAEGTATGAGAPPGGEWKGGLRGLFPGWKPPPPPTKSPGEAGPAPGLEEDAAGDSAISRGLRSSGSPAGRMSYGVSRGFPGRLRWPEWPTKTPSPLQNTHTGKHIETETPPSDPTG